MRTDIYASTMSIDEYKEEKLEVFEGFKVVLDDDELAHFNELTTEIAIDNFARDVINRRLKGRK